MSIRGLEMLLDTLFPFHFELDGELRFARIGPALAHRFPSTAVGLPFAEVFTIERPVVEVDFEAIRRAARVLMVLRHSASEVTFTGQFVELGDRSSIFYFGGPWISNLSDLTRANLRLSDFPPHDPRGDLLLQAQVRETMLADLADSNRRMKEAEQEKRRLQLHIDRVQRIDVAAQVSGGLAHNFNNLLALMNGHIELAVMRLRAGDFEGSLDRIGHVLTASQEAAVLVKQLQNLSADRTIELREVNLLEAIQRTKLLVQPLLGPSVHWEVTGEPGLPAVAFCDPHALQEVLVNLSINAAEAMDHQGRISVAVRHDGREIALKLGLPVTDSGLVCLEFADNGPGFPAGTVERAFQPFYTSKGESHTGLGLATVERLVTLTGGLISLTSEPGEGACFRIFFKPVEKGVPTTARRVLLVDDDEPVREVVADLLDAAGFVVHAFSDPVAALHAVESGESFEVVVSDVRMSPMAGPALVSRIEERVGPMPTVFITGFADGAIAREELTLDAQHVLLQKPFNVNQLTTSIESAVSGKGLDR